MWKTGLKKYVLYVFKKIVFILMTMWVVATFTFILMHCLPGDPFIKDKAIPPKILENLNTRYGLDKPMTEQYKVYMGRLLKGDLGISMVYKNKSVNSIVGRAFPVSLD
ncbi:MAG: ABC transporter permease, partial [Clostridiaceae bacterium]|nr:ABC transporter permease [Clostridiaceae bacterium]